MQKNELYSETIKIIRDHRKHNQKGKAIDIHKLIGKIPHQKPSWVPPKYKYLGPYNPLDDRLKYDTDGNITAWYVMPYNKLDTIAAHHDVCYSIRKTNTNVTKND